MPRQGVCLIGSLALLAACLTEGERAGGGGCPVGESCSPDTPMGLYFGGARLSDVEFSPGIKTTAVGGEQTIRVYEGSELDEFSSRFTAETTSAELEVLAVAPPDILIAGVEAGATLLRVLDRRTGLLFDRVEITAEELAEVRVAPGDGAPIGPLGEREDPSWALLAEPEASIIVRLTSSAGTRLVDEALSLSVDAPATGRRAAWDRLTLDDPPPGVLTYRVEAAGQVHEGPIRVVDSVDELSVQFPEDLDAPLELGVSAVFCFQATQGALEVIGRGWSFSATGSVEVDPFGFSPRCAQVTPSSPGSGEVQADFAGVSLTVPVEVIAPATGDSSPAPAPGEPPPAAPRATTPGERAAALD